jgi:hypothetical protein
MLEFEIREFLQVCRSMYGLAARAEKIFLLPDLAADSHPDSKLLDNMVETA